jgi:NADH-quinone oxidoreductase subunit M
MTTVLVAMIFVPLVGAAIVLAAGSAQPHFVRLTALTTSIVTLFLALAVAAGYSPATAKPLGPGPIQPQLKLERTWVTLGRAPSAASAEPAKLQFYVGIDGISLWLVVLTAILVFSCVLVSWESITERVAAYYALLLVLETGLLGVFCAFDIVLFYVFFEFTLIPLYFLIGIWGGPAREYAARKFFLYTLAGSVLSLVGLVALVAALHSRDPSQLTFSIPKLAAQIHERLDLAGGNPVAGRMPLSPEDQLAERVYWTTVQTWIFFALFAGFAIKVPLFPFHTWLPLAHVEAPTAGSVLLAGVLLKLGTYGFLRLCLPMLPLAVEQVGAPLLAALSLVGILYGAWCALAQNDIKRLVAYSSVSHMGFCMLGMAALNREGITGSVLQMINHGLSTGALFLLVGMIYDRYHSRMMDDFGGLARRLPVLAVFMVVSCMSSLGLPGLNGFVGEVTALIGMFDRWPGCAVIGAIGIVFGAWYLLAMLQRVFFGPARSNEPAHATTPISDLTLREVAALGPIVVLYFWIGLWPEFFVRVMRPDIDRIAILFAQ